MGLITHVMGGAGFITTPCARGAKCACSQKHQAKRHSSYCLEQAAIVKRRSGFKVAGKDSVSKLFLCQLLLLATSKIPETLNQTAPETVFCSSLNGCVLHTYRRSRGYRTPGGYYYGFGYGCKERLHAQQQRPGARERGQTEVVFCDLLPWNLRRAGHVWDQPSHPFPRKRCQRLLRPAPAQQLS